ncbi:MAG: lipid II flippase Amj family protein [Armatimonadetes bacterium]|nr:lipid II flippase Amj family protein [Armatimonadota bacterium]
MDRLLVVAILTAIIHMTDTLVYAVRFSGVSTKRLATAFSLFQIISLLASTANLIQAPLLSSVVEQVINTGLKESSHHQELLLELNHQIRLVIFSATAGTVAGVLFTPLFISVFTRIIFLFEEAGSIPRLILMLLSPRWIFLFISKKKFWPARRRLFDQRNIPLTFLVANVIIIGIWTTGVLSALYAGTLIPDYRSTASLLSGVVNGMATILSAVVVDPTAATITDQALRGERDQQDVKQMVYYLCLTRIFGTLLAQILFLPAACLIKYCALFIVGL